MIYAELIKFGVNVAAVAIQYKQPIRANRAILYILMEHSEPDKAYLIYYLSILANANQLVIWNKVILSSLVYYGLKDNERQNYTP